MPATDRIPLRTGSFFESSGFLTADAHPLVIGLPMLSFWLATGLISALLFKTLWNRAARRSESWPRLGLKATIAALGIMCLIPVGALLLAEEIRPQFRRLFDAEPSDHITRAEDTAIALHRLGRHLAAHAEAHGGYLPEQPQHLTTGAGDAADAALWRAPGADLLLFTYLPPMPPVPVDQLDGWIVAWAPTTNRDNRLALTADGTVMEFDSHDLRDRVVSQLQQLQESVDGSFEQPPQPPDAHGGP